MENTVNIFELASKEKLRFDASNHTNLTTEQLWDLPLQTTRNTGSDLDSVGKILLRALREQEEESLISSGTNMLKERLQLKLDVVKAIIASKQAENAAKVAEKARAQEGAFLRQLLMEKHADEMKNMTKEQIEARLKELGAS